MNWWLIERFCHGVDAKDVVFLFGAFEICPTIEEYARILGVHHDINIIISPSLNTGFKLWIPRLLGLKRAYKNNNTAFLASRDEWNQNHTLAMELDIWVI